MINEGAAKQGTASKSIKNVEIMNRLRFIMIDNWEELFLYYFLIILVGLVTF